jgi:hypothetical protein
MSWEYRVSVADMARKPDLDEQTVRIAEQMLRMPPKPHDDMKLGARKLAKPVKERPASKGRVHKGKTHI